MGMPCQYQFTSFHQFMFWLEMNWLNESWFNFNLSMPKIYWITTCIRTQPFPWSETLIRTYPWNNELPNTNDLFSSLWSVWNDTKMQMWPYPQTRRKKHIIIISLYLVTEWITQIYDVGKGNKYQNAQVLLQLAVSLWWHNR